MEWADRQRTRRTISCSFNRLGDPEELEFMGIRDYFTDSSHCLVEWPERGEGVLPQADIDLTLSYDGLQRIIELQANTEVGMRVLGKL